jgi:hypothetical protein
VCIPAKKAHSSFWSPRNPWTVGGSWTWSLTVPDDIALIVPLSRVIHHLSILLAKDRCLWEPALSLPPSNAIFYRFPQPSLSRILFPRSFVSTSPWNALPCTKQFPPKKAASAKQSCQSRWPKQNLIDPILPPDVKVVACKHQIFILNHFSQKSKADPHHRVGTEAA